MYILELSGQDWVAIIGAIAAASTVIGASLVGVIMAINNANRKLDDAAVRREQIAKKPDGE